MTEHPHTDDETTTPPQGDELLDGSHPQPTSADTADRPNVDDESVTPPAGDALLGDHPSE